MSCGAGGNKDLPHQLALTTHTHIAAAIISEPIEHALNYFSCQLPRSETFTKPVLFVVRQVWSQLLALISGALPHCAKSASQGQLARFN